MSFIVADITRACSRYWNEVLPPAIFSFGKAERAPCSTVTQATDNAADGKMASALQVAPKKTPLLVARRSFGFTKNLSSRLDWRFFRRNRTRFNSVNRPLLQLSGQTSDRYFQLTK
jgi:hypothetical protein